MVCSQPRPAGAGVQSGPDFLFCSLPAESVFLQLLSGKNNGIITKDNVISFVLNYSNLHV